MRSLFPAKYLLAHCDIPCMLCDNTVYFIHWTRVLDLRLALNVKVLVSRGNYEVISFHYRQETRQYTYV
jgi:hypothetical protein